MSLVTLVCFAYVRKSAEISLFFVFIFKKLVQFVVLIDPPSHGVWISSDLNIICFEKFNHSPKAQLLGHTLTTLCVSPF